METGKLYYEDCHLYTFTSRVLTCEAREKGYAVTLEETAFYPEGGGQACDLGTLDDARVLDVQEVDGKVFHLCDKPLKVGAAVTGCIDRDRRFDLMQQHSGEHIVSGLVHSLLGHHNVGFHVGSDRMEIDFDGPITPEQLAMIETKANEAVWQNLPVRCWYPTEAQLPNTFYRTKKALPWPVRIVQIPGYDSCACCGVHVSHTGEIGLIKIISCVKFHQGVRIELCCGGRALRLLQGIFEENRAVSAAFSAKMLETGAAARKMNEALAAEKLRANTLQTRLLRQSAQSYADAGNVLHFEENLDGNQLRELTDAIAKVCRGRAAVFSGSGEAWNVCILHPGCDLSGLISEMKAAFSVRGGGRPGTFQGTVQATKDQVEDFFRRVQ